MSLSLTAPARTWLDQELEALGGGDPHGAPGRAQAQHHYTQSRGGAVFDVFDTCLPSGSLSYSVTQRADQILETHGGGALRVRHGPRAALRRSATMHSRRGRGDTVF